MIVELISFGFKNNDTPNSNHLIDIRFLNNPFYVDSLRNLNGLDQEVIDFFKSDKTVRDFLSKLFEWIEYILENNYNAKKEKITIAIGCTGGQHRSPYITENLGKHLLKNKRIKELSVYHKELNKYNVLTTAGKA